MRATLSLDDDVVTKLKDDMRKTGRSFRETVNDYLRRGLLSRRTTAGGPSVILVDANVLLYAYHPRAVQHERARTWVETAFSGKSPVATDRDFRRFPRLRIVDPLAA